MRTVACLGSSSTASKGPYDWIGDLQRRPGNEDLKFVRFAAGGDLAYDGLQRVPKVLDCDPDFVVVLLGGNDVMASMPEKSIYYETMLKLTKHLPRKPTVSWFEETMEEIVDRLKDGTSAKIALCSLPPWGEDLESQDPFQAGLNAGFAEYNAILKAIAKEAAVTYIPFYERMVELMSTGPSKAFTSFKILPFYRDIFRQVVERKTNDQIGDMNGWRFHRDGIHLNSTSGILLAGLVQNFLDGKPS